MEYVSIAEAQAISGLRLVLSAGVPGPWGEGAKGLFAARSVDYVPVAQLVTQPNEDLKAWTGHRNAPTAMLDDEPARIRWYEIVALAERLGTGVSLLPTDEVLRVAAVGICHELCSEDGFGWNRRIAMISRGANHETATDEQRAASRSFGQLYGYRDEIVPRAIQRQVAILSMLAHRLERQQSGGSNYLVGETMTAADIYWACFAALLEPLPQELCAMPERLRQNYANVDTEVRAQVDIPRLLAHRDFVYANHLATPLDF
jgi:glutathione S-transferase